VLLSVQEWRPFIGGGAGRGGGQRWPGREKFSGRGGSGGDVGRVGRSGGVLRLLRTRYGMLADLGNG
jgi:hypothetical protein